MFRRKFLIVAIENGYAVLLDLKTGDTQAEAEELLPQGAQADDIIRMARRGWKRVVGGKFSCMYIPKKFQKALME